jgi:hypothetical protein
LPFCKHQPRLALTPARTRRPRRTATAEIHDYHDDATSVLAASLAKRAAGYTSLGFPDPAASPTHPVRAPLGKSLTHSLDNQCAIARNPGLRALELNHCSTTRDSSASSAANHSPYAQHPDQDEHGPQPTRAAREAVSQTAPSVDGQDRSVPCFTWGFDSGRCWVRTNVG